MQRPGAVSHQVIDGRRARPVPAAASSRVHHPTREAQIHRFGFGQMARAKTLRAANAR